MDTNSAAALQQFNRSQITWLWVGIILTVFSSLMNFYGPIESPIYGWIFMVMALLSVFVFLLKERISFIPYLPTVLLMFQGLALAMAGYSFYHMGKMFMPHLFVVAGAAFFVVSGMKLLDKM
jgi:hypothetical protein